MNDLSLWLVASLSRFLEPAEWEAVQGDLIEAGETGWQATRSVSGLLLRRQAELWHNWRPWLAAFGLAVPGSFLLMGLSISVTRGFQQILGPDLRPGLLLLLCNVILLVGWA